jgi:hypothetical protein
LLEHINAIVAAHKGGLLTSAEATQEARSVLGMNKYTPKKITLNIAGECAANYNIGKRPE